MSLFYENHDNPRITTKINKDLSFSRVLPKLLALIQLTSKGTPFIYQGQEIGAINQRFSSIEDIRDIESINLYEELIKTMEPQEAFERVLAGTRDHARVPMVWDSGPNRGFSTATPWIIGDEESLNNVEASLSEEFSVLNFYKSLIALRKQHKALVYGEVEFINIKAKDILAYYRITEEETFYIECNLSPTKKKRLNNRIYGYELLLSNYRTTDEELKAYEANVYRVVVK